MNTSKRQKNRGSSGFTLIEIIAALVVFMIGVMGMVALQGASITATTKSREQTAAVGIARYMITQLKSEFANWDSALALPSDAYPLLNTVFGDVDNIERWVQYGGEVASGGDLRFDDLFGHSGLSDGAAARFCVNYRVETLETFSDDVTATLADYNVWLIRVRVSWTKDGYFQSGETNWNVCSPDDVESRILNDGSDDVVELVSTATREFTR